MCTAAHRLLRLRERLDQASGRHNLRLAGHRHRRPRVQSTHAAQRLERDLRRLGEEAAEVEPGLLDEEANRRRHAHPPVLDLSGGAQRTASALRTASASSTGYRAAAAPTSAVRIHSYWELPYGHISEMPIGSQGLPPVSGPAPGSCLQAGGTSVSTQALAEGQHRGRGALERHLHVRPSRRRRRDRRLERLHEGGGQDLPQPAGAARRQLRLALLLLRRHGSASCGFSGRRPSSPTPSRAASAQGEP